MVFNILCEIALILAKKNGQNVAEVWQNTHVISCNQVWQMLSNVGDLIVESAKILTSDRCKKSVNILGLVKMLQNDTAENEPPRVSMK